MRWKLSDSQAAGKGGDGGDDPVHNLHAGIALGEGLEGYALLPPPLRLAEDGGNLLRDVGLRPSFLGSDETAGGLPEGLGVGILMRGGPGA